MPNQPAIVRQPLQPTTAAAPAVLCLPPPANAASARWFVEEVLPHDAQLKAYLRASFPAVCDVDDVVQESYLRVWKSCAVQSIRTAKPFLFKVARHVALNLVARARSSPIFAVGDLAELPVIENRPGVVEAAATNEKLRLLVEALATLPPRCRDITVLRKLKGIPQKTVAAQFGLSERTIEEQVSRGVRRCEAFLRKHGLTSSTGL